MNKLIKFIQDDWELKLLAFVLALILWTYVVVVKNDKKKLLMNKVKSDSAQIKAVTNTENEDVVK
ncbi:MAG: hypothetical protein ABII27_02910 [bacterium]